jgi:hypothetical protein
MLKNKEKNLGGRMENKIREELRGLYDFVSAEENEGFGFSLSQSWDRIEFLEKLLKGNEANSKAELARKKAK